MFRGCMLAILVPAFGTAVSAIIAPLLFGLGTGVASRLAHYRACPTRGPASRSPSSMWPRAGHLHHAIGSMRRENIALRVALPAARTYRRSHRGTRHVTDRPSDDRLRQRRAPRSLSGGLYDPIRHFQRLRVPTDRSVAFCAGLAALSMLTAAPTCRPHCGPDCVPRAVQCLRRAGHRWGAPTPPPPRCVRPQVGVAVRRLTRRVDGPSPLPARGCSADGAVCGRCSWLHARSGAAARTDLVRLALL